MIGRQISYSEDIVQKVCNFRGVDIITNLKFIIRFPGVVDGCSFVQYSIFPIMDDEYTKHILSIPSDFKTCFYFGSSISNSNTCGGIKLEFVETFIDAKYYVG